MEAVMLKYYTENINRAGTGLECLPGVKQLLEALKVNTHTSWLHHVRACNLVQLCKVQHQLNNPDDFVHQLCTLQPLSKSVLNLPSTFQVSKA